MKNWIIKFSIWAGNAYDYAMHNIIDRTSLFSGLCNFNFQYHIDNIGHTNFEIKIVWPRNAHEEVIMTDRWVGKVGRLYQYSGRCVQYPWK